MTHNLIVHALTSIKRVLRRGFIGVKAFVEKLACAKAWLVRRDEVTILAHTNENPTVRQYINCMQGDGPTLLDYATSGYLRQT
jgi:hypothetical protein